MNDNIKRYFPSHISRKSLLISLLIDGKQLFVCKELSWLVPQSQIAINCDPKYEAIYWEWKLGNMLFYMFWIYGRLINSNNNNNKTNTLCLMCIHIYADRSKAIWHIKKLLKFFVVLFRECFIFFHIYISINSRDLQS